MSIETRLARFKAGVSGVSRVHPGHDTDSRETLNGFHEVSEVTDDRAIRVRETSATPKVSVEVQPKTAPPRACTRETLVTPKTMKPESERLRFT
ncbi:MAG: hypothetical protein LBI87_02885 [Candidatus Accumulibacter sp.]|jgi:hypothetical protein|nr:hypothetical protein [Accumulibacter sp.]